jgi:hypothetical protein
VLLRRRIERARDGGIRVRLPAEERLLVRSVTSAVAARLAEDPGDAALRRLFPPAHRDDAEAEREYRSLVHDELLEGRRDALRLVEETLERERLTEVEGEAWLRALNDVRLVLGTLLDVTEDLDVTAVDRDDPHAHDFAVYSYLTWLQEQLVEVLASGVPDDDAPRG